MTRVEVRTDDPAHDWEVHCAELEAQEAGRMRGKVCRDCHQCEVNPDDDSRWGWCACLGDWCDLGEPVGEIDCGGFC